MSSTSRAGSYRAVLALPYALRTFAPALIGRLAYGLLPLSTLFTVQQSTDSFAAAGMAVAAFGLTALLMPVKARLIDRFGQRRVLPLLAVASGLLLVALAFAAGAVPLIVLASLAGVAFPPLGPSMRANWRELTAGTDLKQRAFALDSICEESLYLVGPLLTGVLLAFFPARIALLGAAFLLVFGTLVMVGSPVLRRWRAVASGPLAFDVGPLSVPALRQLAGIVCAVATGIAMAYTCIAALAARQQLPSAAGYIEAGIALGSVVGGLLWGRRRHTRRRSTHVAALVGVVAAGLLLAGLAGSSLLLLGVVMALTGLGIAPLFVVAFLAADELVPEHERTEASTWVNTANNLGSAAGASVAGLLVDRLTATAGFFTAGTLLTLVAVAVLTRARAIDAVREPGTAR